LPSVPAISETMMAPEACMTSRREFLALMAAAALPPIPPLAPLQRQGPAQRITGTPSKS
jgi:hypothetical protein